MTSDFHRDAVVAVLSGIIALVTALIVTQVGVQNSNENLSKQISTDRELQAREIRETREAEAREKNVAIYQDVLSGAAALWRSYLDISTCMRINEKKYEGTPPAVSGDFSLRDECTDDEHHKILSRYQRAVNNLYINGTDAAWELQNNLSRALLFSPFPPAVLGPSISEQIEGIESRWKSFSPAYAKFEQNMCRELSVFPGRRCDKTSPGLVPGRHLD